MHVHCIWSILSSVGYTGRFVLTILTVVLAFLLSMYDIFSYHKLATVVGLSVATHNPHTIMNYDL